jgi:hypothetical protein
MGDPTTDDVQQAKGSFELIIDECRGTANSDFFQSGRKCMCCDEVIETSRHAKSAYHLRRVTCIELSRAHCQIKDYRNFENDRTFLDTIRSKLETLNPGGAGRLLNLNAWNSTCCGQNDRRKKLDGAKFWFMDFIIEVDEVCKDMVGRTETDQSTRDMVDQIQAILSALRTDRKRSKRKQPSDPATVITNLEECADERGGQGQGGTGERVRKREPSRL